MHNNYLKVPRKSLLKKVNQSKKFYPDILPYQYRILSVIWSLGYTPTQIANHLGKRWSRQKVTYHIKILISKGYLFDLNPKINKYKLYKITSLGQNVLVQYEKAEKPKFIGIENARWKCIIKNPKIIPKFLYDNSFVKNEMKNWVQYNGKIENFSIQINMGKKTTLVITHPPHYEKDLLSGYLKVEHNVLHILNNIKKKWKVKLGFPEPIPTRQFTMADPFAEELMNKYQGTHIKLGKKISIDQSKQAEPRSEFSELQDAINFASMPNLLKELVKQTNVSNKKTIEIEKYIKANTLAITTMLDSQTKHTDLMKILTEQIMGKSEQKLEQKSNPINNDSSRMFG